MQPFIQIDGLRHVFPLDGGEGVAALDGIDLSIERGEYVAIVGSNGSGKTTLALHLNGLLLPTAGCVRIDGGVTSDADHVARFRLTDMATEPDRLEEVVREIGLGRAILEG